MRDSHWPRGAYVAEFTDERQFAGAVTMLHDAGYRRMEVYTPFPVPTVDALLPNPPSVLPLMVFVAGIGGAILSYWIQWYTNAVSYPLNIGGRPAHAAPAFFIPTFEGTVLCASVIAFVALFAILRLPRPWHPMFEVPGFERASVDHFWLAIDASDERANDDVTPRVLEHLKPLSVARIPGDA